MSRRHLSRNLKEQVEDVSPDELASRFADPAAAQEANAWPTSSRPGVSPARSNINGQRRCQRQAPFSLSSAPEPPAASRRARPTALRPAPTSEGGSGHSPHCPFGVRRRGVSSAPTAIRASERTRASPDPRPRPDHESCRGRHSRPRLRRSAPAETPARGGPGAATNSRL
jgi:hypothetical protein